MGPVDRMEILVAVRCFPGGMAWVVLTLILCVQAIMSVYSTSFFELLLFLFGVFWGDGRREFMQRLSAPLHGALGSYLRNALQEDIADAVACLPSCSSG
jgi:hypothetical protein